MKKNYILQIVCLFFSVKIFALSGVYTINNGLATGGNNYNSFTAFAADINANGVTGPVIVNVNPTTAYVEQVNFNQFTGASATNSVTINGNGATLTYNATNAALPHTLMLSGADYMFFNNLNVSGTNQTNAMVVHLWNASDFNNFYNVDITASTTALQTLINPLSISGTAISPTGLGINGSNNIFDGCDIVGGYNYSVVFYGNSTSPLNTGNGNVFKNGSIRESYLYSFYNVYTTGTVFKNNIIENITRTATSTRYGIVLSTGAFNCLIDGNIVRKLFTSIQGNTNTTYCIYTTVAATTTSPNIIQNNIVSDIISNGAIYGIYNSSTSYIYNYYYHNTVSLDDQTSSYTGTSACMYILGTNCNVKNNLVTMGRAGSGTKYCYYFGATTNFPSSYNVSFISTQVGTRYSYYYTTNYATLSALQAVYPFAETGSQQADPVYTNTLALDYTPTSLQINNMCPFIGVTTDELGVVRSTSSPDPGALEFYTVPCTGSAPPNSVSTPTGVLCQNSNVTIGLANTFTNTGYSVQWLMATASILGPYTAIPGATLNVYNTNTLTTTAYYSATITCINGGSPVTVTSGSVTIATPVINNVPYNEGFEGISKPNQLPNCSWAASSGYTATLTYTSNGTNNRIPHTGTKFASFANTPAGTNYFYSNGINMVTGVTYSAALWFINEAVGYGAWADLSILVGTAQNPSGLTPIVSGSVAVVSYSLLSNTFTVPTSGVYYIAVRAQTGSGCSPYLSWDDLSVTIPCQLNSPPLALNVSSPIVCAGQPVVFTASGANSYTWVPTPPIGQGQSQIASSPSVSTQYTVIGANALSGCTTLMTQYINVLPSPQVVAFASKMVLCEGESTVLYAQGANSYNWSTGVTGSTISVNPTTSTSYSVIGVNQYNCPTLQNIVIAVNQAPSISATPTSTMLCRGDNVTLIGSGAATYQWASTSALVQYGNPLVTSVQTSGGYTVTGTDANGCVGKSYFVLDVEECTGINEFSGSQIDITAYPNPNNGVFTLESKQSGVKAIDIYDVTGRTVFSGSMNNTSKVNISEMPNGVYSIKVKAGEATKYFKIIKAQ